MKFGPGHSDPKFTWVDLESLLLYLVWPDPTLVCLIEMGVKRFQCLSFTYLLFLVGFESLQFGSLKDPEFLSEILEELGDSLRCLGHPHLQDVSSMGWIAKKIRQLESKGDRDVKYKYKFNNTEMQS